MSKRAMTLIHTTPQMTKILDSRDVLSHLSQLSWYMFQLLPGKTEIDGCSYIFVPSVSSGGFKYPEDTGIAADPHGVGRIIANIRKLFYLIYFLITIIHVRNSPRTVLLSLCISMDINHRYRCYRCSRVHRHRVSIVRYRHGHLVLGARPAVFLY